MKKTERFRLFGLLGLMSMVIFSCSKVASDEELQTKEQTLLKQYLVTHNITVAPTSSGLYYIPIDTGTGASPSLDSTAVIFNYSIKLIDDRIVSTNIKSIAQVNGIYSSSTFYYPLKYRLAWWFNGMQQALKMMKEGGKATFILPSSLAYGKEGSSSMGIGSYATVIFYVELIKVIPDMQAYEHQLFTSYLDTIAAEKIADTTSTGVVHIIDVPGTGAYPNPTNSITVFYKAYFIENSSWIIDDNTGGTPFVFSTSSASLIPGFSAGAKLMKLGEKGRLILPYMQAYGEIPSYYTPIPPFSTLVYQYEVSNIQ